MKDRIATSRDLVLKVGRMTLSSLGTIRDVKHKGEIDLVTAADLASQQLLINSLSNAFPKDRFYAEEGAKEIPPGDHLWVIDPLDGTTNFAHGLPFYAISLAFVVDNRVVFGWVYNPPLEELFFASQGQGAFLNGKPIRVSDRQPIGSCLLATGFPYDIRRTSRTNLDHFSRFAVKSRAVRRLGSAALDMAYIAAGRFDGYWELTLSPWDLAAGALMVLEAGGKVTDLTGGEYLWTNRDVVASNGLIHRSMLDILKAKEEI